MRKISILIIAISLLTVSGLKAQYADVFKAGAADMNTIAKGYLSPAGTAFATGLGSNWYNTADVHGVFGFDVNIGSGITIIPTEDQMFSLAGLSSALKPATGVTTAPTFGSFMKEGANLDLMMPDPTNGNTPTKITSFKTPKGVASLWPIFPSVQLTVGLPIINDVTVRYMPKLSIEGFEASMWGLGVKHNLKQYIPVVSLIPLVDAAVMVNYANMDMSYAFESPIKPEFLVDPIFLAPSTTNYTGQAMKIKATSMSANLLVSAKLLFLTPYLGLGVQRTNFDLAMSGTYPTLGGLSSTTGKMIITDVNDPLKFSASEYMPNATLGVRLKLLLLFSIHAQYTFQKYSMASAGIGFTFR